ncbi:DUF4838 domain-containing protein [Sphingobacterium thalpophilum]|uniref:DUF4838 domain-containing protein n=1 Tax=Sphingobacterium thalpophilum TaxID=259 RepID=A0ABV4H8L3_9SPHI
MGNKSLIYICTILLVLATSCQQIFGQDQVVLTSNGRSFYKILVSDNSDLTVGNAAKQLADYLQKVTSANFHIEKVNKRAISYKERFIFVGTADELKNVAPDKRGKTPISEEAISINIERGGNIYLVGGSSRSTLYAVFQFLEDKIGCKWWTPKDESIPRKMNLAIQPGIVNYSPPFYYRSHFINSTTKDAKFATILKENGYNQPLGGIWGNGIDIVGWAHTFKQLIPVDTYFRSHPEWFSDSKNQDRPSTSKSSPPSNANNYQLCLENKALFNEFLKNTLKWIRTVKSKKPNVNIFSISVNDNNKFCRCDDALKIIRTEGSPSASLIIFLNKLITEIHKTYPDVKLQTLAYQQFFSVPKSIKPHKDIIVMIAPLNMIVSKSLTDDSNKTIYNQIKKWGNISSYNYYWGYNTNFNNFFMPFSGISHLQSNFKILEMSNVRGVFLQDNNYTNGVGFFLDMQTWVIGKLMWNPNLDSDKLTKEFFLNYYGKSGEYLYKYYSLLTGAFKKSTTVNTPFGHDFSYINSSLLKQATELFDSALKVSKDNKVIYNRVLKEKFVLDNMNLSLFRPTSKVNNSNKVDDFTTELKNMGVKKVGIDQSIETVIDGRSRTVSSLSGFEVLNGGNTVLIQEGQFSLDKKGVLTNIAEDKNASNGLSAVIEEKAKGWSIQVQTGKYSNYIVPAGIYQVKVTLRANKSSRGVISGNVEVGLYNTVSKKEKAKKLIKASDISKKNYSGIVVFQNRIEATDVIFISLKQAEVGRLYVDKIEISKIG